MLEFWSLHGEYASFSPVSFVAKIAFGGVVFGQFIHGSQGTLSYVGSQQIASFARNNMRAKKRSFDGMVFQQASVGELRYLP